MIVAMADGIAERLRIQQQAHVVDVAQITERQFGSAEPAPLVSGHQAFLHQPVQGFAQGAAGKAVALLQDIHFQFRARLGIATQDVAAQGCQRLFTGGGVTRLFDGFLQGPGGVDALEVVDLPWPQPGAGEVRVRAHAIGVGKPDALIRQGTYRWMPPLPAVPGNELAGVVDAIGGGADPALLGQAVLVSSRELPQRGGCYAQAICVPAAALYPLPPAIAAEEAVNLPNYQLAAALLEVATDGWRPGTLLLHGAAGGVATAVLQLADLQGIAVIGTVSSEAERDFALASGAAHVIRRDTENVAQRVADLTGGRGVDLVLDHVGGPGLLANLDLLAPLGMLVSYNALAGLPNKDLFAELRRHVGRSLAVRCFSIHTLDAMPALRRRLMQSAIDLMAEGRLRPPAPTVLPLSQARRAHELLNGPTRSANWCSGQTERPASDRLRPTGSLRHRAVAITEGALHEDRVDPAAELEAHRLQRT